MTDRLGFRRLLLLATVFLSFLPFLKVLPLAQSELQPLCGFTAALALLSALTLGRAQIISLSLIFLLLMNACVSALFLQAISTPALQLATYVVPLVTFLAVLEVGTTFSSRLLWLVLAIFVVVAVAQVSEVFSLMAAYFEGVIPRVGEVWGGGRGVNLLTPEPSYAATLIFQLFACAVLLSLTGRMSRWARLAFGVGIVFLVLTNRSATIFVLFGIYAFATLVAYGTSTRSLSVLAGVTAAVSLLAVALVVANRLDVEYRFLDLLRTASDEELWRGDVDQLAAALGGKRVITVALGYGSIAPSAGLGYGIGSYPVSFPRTADHYGMDFSALAALNPFEKDPSGMKPDSFGASLTLEAGIVALALLLALLLRIWKLIKNVDKPARSHCIGIYATSSIQILFGGAVSMPGPWVALGLLAYIGARATAAQAADCLRLAGKQA